MKTIFSILVIVVVAVLIGGMFYGVVTAASGTGQASGQERRGNGDFGRSDRNESAGGVQLPVDIIKNLAIISLISVGYLGICKIVRRKKSLAPLKL